MKPKNYQHLTRLFSTFLAFVTSFRAKTVALHNSSKERFLTLVSASISFIRFNVNRNLARLCDQKKIYYNFMYELSSLLTISDFVFQNVPEDKKYTVIPERSFQVS